MARPPVRRDSRRVALVKFATPGDLDRLGVDLDTRYGPPASSSGSHFRQLKFRTDRLPRGNAVLWEQGRDSMWVKAVEQDYWAPSKAYLLSRSCHVEKPSGKVMDGSSRWVLYDRYPRSTQTIGPSGSSAVDIANSLLAKTSLNAIPTQVSGDLFLETHAEPDRPEDFVVASHISSS